MPFESEDPTGKRSWSIYPLPTHQLKAAPGRALYASRSSGLCVGHLQLQQLQKDPSLASLCPCISAEKAFLWCRNLISFFILFL